MGILPSLHSKSIRDPQDWKYVQFHPELAIELHRVTDDEHELHVLRSAKAERPQFTFTLFPDLEDYGSRDLFVCHPSDDKADLWRWTARADDIVVFQNGEKMNPVSMEQHITARNPEVSAVLVAGAQRFQASLLIEPVSEGKELVPAERAALIEKSIRQSAIVGDKNFFKREEGTLLHAHCHLSDHHPTGKSFLITNPHP